MTAPKKDQMKISLGNAFNGVIEFNGVTLQVAPGNILADVGESGQKFAFTPANQNPATAIGSALEALEIGQRMKDGTVYFGLDPSTKETLFTLPTLSAGLYTFNEVAKAAEKANSHPEKSCGHANWQPMPDEVLALYTAPDTWKKLGIKLEFSKETGRDSAPALWSAAPDGDDLGRYRWPGYTYWYLAYRTNALRVPLVLRGPARS